ncbi:MAG: DUF6485 family protein [Candidatus Marinimicrobia bacterium]|nr:DUF6485 family protein [Candidatus Neomarinimicrobiota bacterium]
MECRMEENLRNCNCTYSCPRKGICCECIEYHRRKRQLPACFYGRNRADLLIVPMSSLPNL